MIKDLFTKFDGACSPSTIRAYQNDFKQYLTYYKENHNTAITPEADKLADYVEDMSLSMKSATIRRRINNLGSVFRLSRVTDPTKDADVILALIRHASADWSRPRSGLSIR